MTVQELQVLITANTAQLTQQMSGVNSAFDSIQAQAKKAGAGMGKAFSGAGKVIATASKAIAVGLAAGATALVGMAVKSAEYCANIDDVAQRTGLSATSLQEWKYVAEQSGTSMEVIAKSATKLSTKMADAAGGGKASSEMFAKLGISVEDSNGKLKSTDDIFPQVIDKLAGMGNETERNALCMELFGKSAAEMGPILNAGKSGIQQMKDEAHRLGLVLSDETINAGAQFDDSFAKMKSSLTAVATVVGAQVMPVIQGFMDWIFANLPTIQSVVSTVFKVISKVITVAIDIFTTYVLPTLTKFYNWIVTNMPQIKSTVTTVMDGVKSAFKTASDWITTNLLPIFEKIKTKVDENMPTIQSVIQVASDAIKLAFGLISDAAKLVVDGVLAFSNWCLDNQGTLETIAIVIGSIATAWALVNGALAIWNVIGVIGAGVTWLMAYGTTALGLAFLSVSWPVVLVIAAIAAVIAIGVLLWKNWDVIKAKLIEWKDALVAKFTEVKDKVVAKVTELKDKVVAKFAEIKQGITDKVTAVKTAVVNKFTEIKTGITNKVTEIKTAVVNKFNEIKTSVTTTVTNVKTAVVNKFNEIKTGVSTAITNVKTTVVGKFNEIKTSVTTAVGNIKTTVVNKFNEIKSGAATAFNNVKTAVMTPINDLKSKVSGVVNSIKGFFSGMHLTMPSIKMPHFSVSGKLSLSPPSVPKLNVNWYETGAVFKKATQIGVGENGAEAVMPLERNLGWIDGLASKITARMPKPNTPQQATNNNNSNNNNDNRPLTVIMKVGSAEIGRVVIDSINKLQRQSGTILLDL